MLKLAIKTVFFILAGYGLLTVFQNLSPLFNQALKNPQLSQSPLVQGAVDTANQILPQSQQLSLPEENLNSNQSSETITRTITQIITEKVAETAETASDNLKQAAKDQACQEIYDKVNQLCPSLVQ